MDARELYNELQETRREAPVLWALLAGKRTVPTIAEHLIMTKSEVHQEVEALLDDGVIAQGHYMGREVLKIVDPELQRLAKFAWKLRLKVTDKKPPAEFHRRPRKN